MSLTKKIILIIFSIIAGTTVAITTYGMVLYSRAQQTIEQTYNPIATPAQEIERTRRIQATEPISILLMGIDTGDVGRVEGFAGRSTTMMVVTLNPTKQETTIVSIARDSLNNFAFEGFLDIPGVGLVNTFADKLNHTFAYGGARLTRDTINQLLDIEINYYMAINMGGLGALVDAVGGIQIDNQMGEFYVNDSPKFNITVQPGLQIMDGNTALAYTRMRKFDPDGDIGRQRRQREVLEEIVNRLLSVNTVANYQRIFDALADNMQTDISFANMMNLVEGYHTAGNTINYFQLAGMDHSINGIYYQLLLRENILEITNILRVQKGLPEVAFINPNIITFENQTGLLAPFTFDIRTGRPLEMEEEIPEVHYE
ncbi:MAG: LCP family protein [Streptococcaceae bacterium]|jgi:LCP family protein required for cell wall assembly|nr:LCP family protein [Streptococcaceae bacterium]